MYLTEKEVMSQHIALAKTYERIVEQTAEIKTFFQAANRKKFVFIGCGSSYMLSKSCERMFSARPGISACALAGGDYLLNTQMYAHTVEDSIVVALSRSGETSEILRAVEQIRTQLGAPILSVTMQEENSLKSLSDLSVVLPWAFDESVCQTRTVTNLYASALLLNAILFEDDLLRESVHTAIAQNEAFKLDNRAALEAIAARDFDNVVVLGDSVLNGIGEEGALAFCEVAMLSGRYSNLLDYRHGPMVLNGPRTLNIVCLLPAQGSYQRDMLADLKKKGGILLVLDGESENLYGADLHIGLHGLDHPWAYGIPFIYLAQMTALSKAIALGGNPDQPTGLNAWITLK